MIEDRSGRRLDCLEEPAAPVVRERGAPSLARANDHGQAWTAAGRIGSAFVAHIVELRDMKTMTARAHLGGTVGGAIPADAGVSRGYLDECHSACSHVSASCSGTRTGVRFRWRAYRTDVRLVKPLRPPHPPAPRDACRSRTGDAAPRAAGALG